MKLRIEPSCSDDFVWTIDPDAMDYTATRGIINFHREQYFLEWLMASELPKTVSIIEEQLKD